MCSTHDQHNGCKARLVYCRHAGRYSAAAKADQTDARGIDFVARLSPINQTADVDDVDSLPLRNSGHVRQKLLLGLGLAKFLPVKYIALSEHTQDVHATMTAEP